MSLPHPSASLQHLIILNPLIPSPSPSEILSDPWFKDADREDFGELAQMVYWWSAPAGAGQGATGGPSKRNAGREGALRQMGLAKGLMGFLNMAKPKTNDVSEYRIVRSVDRTTIIWTPEPDFLIIAIVKAKPSPSTTTNKVTGAPASTKTKTSDSTSVASGTGMTSLEIDSTLRFDLRRAYERYRLLNGSLARLLEEHGATQCRAKIRSYWSEWANGYNITGRRFTGGEDGVEGGTHDIVTLKYDRYTISSSPSSTSISPSDLSTLLLHLSHLLSLSLPSKPDYNPPPPIQPRDRQASFASTLGESRLWTKSLGFDMWPRSVSGTSRTPSGQGVTKVGDAGSGLQTHRRAESVPDPASAAQRPVSTSKWQVPGVSLGLGTVGGLFGLSSGGRSRVGSEVVDLGGNGKDGRKSAGAEEGLATDSRPTGVVQSAPEPSETVIGQDDGLASALSDAQIGSLPHAPVDPAGKRVKASSIPVWMAPYEESRTLTYAVEGDGIIAVLRYGVDPNSSSDQAEVTHDTDVRLLEDATSWLRSHQVRWGASQPSTNVLDTSTSWLAVDRDKRSASGSSQIFDSGPSQSVSHWLEKVQQRLPATVEVFGRTMDNKWLVASAAQEGEAMYLQVARPEATLVDAGRE